MMFRHAFRGAHYALFVLTACGLAAAQSSAGPREEARPAPFPPPPMIQSVSPMQAMLQPGQVKLTGTGLGSVREVLVAGQPAILLQRSATELWIEPPQQEPGFKPVLAKSVAGMASGARLQVWPTVEVEVRSFQPDVGVNKRATVTAQRAKTLHVRLANGDDGIYVLGASAELRTTPLVLTAPLTGYELWLDDSFVILSVGILPSADPLDLDFKLPPDLHGLPVHVQAWCQQRMAPGTLTRCFSNVASGQM